MKKEEELKICVLSVSGGMDSTCLLLRLISEGYLVYCVSFNYGQKHSVEIERFESNFKDLSSLGMVHRRVVDISGLKYLLTSSLTSDDLETPEGHYEDENMKQTVVPNRNAIFSSILYGYALSLSKRYETEVSIALGVHSGDHAIYPDCRPEFYNKLFDAFEEGNWDSDKVKLYLPYLSADKGSILRDGIVSAKKIGVDFMKVIENTSTCYKPNKLGESCGKCGSCTERLEAFAEIGLKDPILYS